ncbi:MAG: cell division protein FtsQ/DivIB [Candidatus Paceibacterota bacterium]
MRKAYHKKTNKKILRFKKRRKKKLSPRKLIFTIVGILVFAGLSGIGINYITSQANTVDMKVSGIDEKSSIKSEELKKAAQETFNTSLSFMGIKIETQNFLVSNQKKIASLMARFPQIENIDIKKDSNGNIIFEVREKTPFAIWCENEKCSLIDKQGILIREYNNNEEEHSQLPKVSKQQWADSEEYKKKIMDCVSKISEAVAKNEHFKHQSYEAFSDRLTVKGDIECKLIFDPNEDISWQIEKVETIFKNEGYVNNLPNYLYIDLRFKNQAIIK